MEKGTMPRFCHVSAVNPEPRDILEASSIVDVGIERDMTETGLDFF
jgi:hypothetical protein